METAILQKLRLYANELKATTEEAKRTLSKYDQVCDLTTYLEGRHALKVSSVLLDELSKCLTEVYDELRKLDRDDIDTLPSELLFDALTSANNAEVEAKVVRIKVDAKLSHLIETGITPFPQSASTSRRNVVLANSKTGETAMPDGNVGTLGSPDEVSMDVRGNVRSGTGKPVNLVPYTSSPTNAELGEQSRRKFNLKRVVAFNDDHEFALFWEEFCETVNKSPLRAEHKFAALRYLVRGEPYRLFLDLNYWNEAGYKKAVERLFDNYASDALKQKKSEQENRGWRSLDSSVEKLKDWSDAYFEEEYCKAVPKYETPQLNDQLLKAVKSFLNVYVRGPCGRSDEHLNGLWLILLHGASKPSSQTSSQMSYLMNNFSTPVFGRSTEKVHFSNLPNEERNCTLHISVSEERADTVLKSWYEHWWKKVENQQKQVYQGDVNYFAFLSMVLFRAALMPIESVQRYLTHSFNHDVAVFFNFANLPDMAPPHSSVFGRIKNSLFKPNSSYFRTYVTYMMGCYTFSNDIVTKDFVASGCLHTLMRTSAGSIYWLERAAQSIGKTPQELLEFLLIDPSMETQANNIYRVLELYKGEGTWRWARLLGNNKLKELSIAECPELAYACFILDRPDQTEDITSRKCPSEFSGFINEADPPSLTGENLGIFLKNIMDADF